MLLTSEVGVAFSICRFSEEGIRDRVFIVSILFQTFDALVACTKESVPQTGLFAIVMAALPPLAVVEVVVLDHEIGIEDLQEPAQRGRGRRIDTETAVAHELGEDDILVADPGIVEAHRQAHEFKGDVGQQGDPDDVEELLLGIGIECEKRVRVLCEVVSAVVLPKAANVVHKAVVDVEPEIEHDTIKADLEGKPDQVY